MEFYRCLCCGFKTMETRGEFDICPVCFWEDDTYFDFSQKPFKGMYYESQPDIGELLDIPSGANHGLTLRKAQENYRSFGSCDIKMLPYVRRPRKNEE